MGGFPCPGKRRGHPDKSARPLSPLPLLHLSNPRVGGRGRGKSPSPPPPAPAQAVQHLRGRQGPGHARARTHTPAGLTTAHTHIHTHNSKQRVWTPLSPPASQAGEGGASPPQPLCKVSFRAESCGWEPGPGTPEGGDQDAVGFLRSPRKPGPTSTPFEGFRAASGLWVCGEDPRCRRFPGFRRYFPGFRDRELTGPSETGSREPELPKLGTGRRKLPHQRQDFPNLPAQHVRLGAETEPSELLCTDLATSSGHLLLSLRYL